MSMRPYYLPWEFQTVVVSCSYVAFSVNIKSAVELLAEDAMLAKYSRAPLFILEDFNNCRLDCVLPSFQQYVGIPTRRENICIMVTFRTHSILVHIQYSDLLTTTSSVSFQCTKKELKRHKP